MKVEILEITPVELLAMLDSQNPVDLCKLLIQTLALAAEKVTIPQLQKEVSNELLDYCETLVFEADLVKDVISDAKQPKYTEFYECESDVLADIADANADDKINEFREQNYFNTL